jgi:hypothetical protein
MSATASSSRRVDGKSFKNLFNQKFLFFYFYLNKAKKNKFPLFHKREKQMKNVF